MWFDYTHNAEKFYFIFECFFFIARAKIRREQIYELALNDRRSHNTRSLKMSLPIEQEQMSDYRFNADSKNEFIAIELR